MGAAARLKKGGGTMSRVLTLAGTALLLAALLFACAPASTPPATHMPLPPTVSPLPVTVTTPSGTAIGGTVLVADGTPLARAAVRIQGTQNEARTDANGTFRLSGLEEGLAVTISAWADGYYCANAVEVVPPAEGITLTLRAVQTTDNPGYTWIPPVGDNSCYSCKPGITQVWLDNDRHARSAANIRFLTMYNGTDASGRQSPATRYGYSRDYGRIPLQPDPSKPYYGPGYKLDFPNTAGNCAACHTPAPAINDPYGVDPNTVTGVDDFGIHCDFCHKIADVTLDPATGLPYPNMPGVLSMDIRRPFPEDADRYQLFFGTFDDDNVPMEDTYLPLIEQSAYCAPCHFGVFWDTVIYNSYGEWLDSPYSSASYEGARTCQQCHMPSPTILDGEPITNVAPRPEASSAIRPRSTPTRSLEPPVRNCCRTL